MSDDIHFFWKCKRVSPFQQGAQSYIDPLKNPEKVYVITHQKCLKIQNKYYKSLLLSILYLAITFLLVYYSFFVNLSRREFRNNMQNKKHISINSCLFDFLAKFKHFAQIESLIFFLFLCFFMKKKWNGYVSFVQSRCMLLTKQGI